MLTLLVAQVALLTSAPAGASAPGSGLRPGVFLYAAPQLQTPAFAESVILLVEHHETKGSFGLVINRPTRVPLREFAKRGALSELDLALYFGGPVQPDGVLALLRSATSLAGATRVLPDVYLCTDLDRVEVAARGPGATGRLRLYAGYTGWGANQLAGELRRGVWVVGPADARSIFTAEPEALWPRVHDLLERREVRR